MKEKQREWEEEDDDEERKMRKRSRMRRRKRGRKWRRIKRKRRRIMRRRNGEDLEEEGDKGGWKWGGEWEAMQPDWKKKEAESRTTTCMSKPFPQFPFRFKISKLDNQWKQFLNAF